MNRRRFSKSFLLALASVAGALLVSPEGHSAAADPAATSLADAPPNLRAAIERTLYAIEPAETAGDAPVYRATNRAQALSSTFSAGGFRVRAKKDGESFEWGLQLRALGRGEELAGVPEATLVRDENRIEYRRGNVTEWYVNDARGVEQGFTLAERPVGDTSEPLRVELAVLGDLVPLPENQEADELTFGRDESGPALLRYEALVAFDATGRELPAEMKQLPRTGDAPARLQLVVADSGALYPLTIDPLVVLAETKLTASGAAADDYFGYSVAISGDTAVVGARSDDDAGKDSGSAHVFLRDLGGPDAWGEAAKLTASDAAFNDYFGYSVAISGDTAVVGAYGDDDAGNASGSAYVFLRDLGGPDAWGEAAKLMASDAAAGDEFGRSVAISDDTAVVGAHGDDDAGSASGSAYVFLRDLGGPDAWGEAAKLTASDAAAGDWFGIAVAISGDTAVVGAAYDDDAGAESGSAYVFLRALGGPDAWGEAAKLTAARDLFGISVAISGDTAVVGAYGNAGGLLGSAYVFLRDLGGPDAWGEAAELTASDTAGYDYFGISVAISGDTAVVGAYGNDDAGGLSGSAYVFLRDLGGPDAWGETAKLTASDATAGDYFGISVAISGDTAVVGAYGDDDAGSASGSAYVLDLGPSDCDNGLDDDGDGLADFPLDPGCASAGDLSELGLGACDDGADNDGDGRTDFDPLTFADPTGQAGTGDPGCGHPIWPMENPACQDGIDNDGLLGTDFDGGESVLGIGNGDPNGADPQCLDKPWVGKEANPTCGLGSELSLILLPLAALRRTWRSRRA